MSEENQKDRFVGGAAFPLGARGNTLGQVHQVDQCNAECTSKYVNPRILIDHEIDKLTSRLHDLHALRRALPEEMLPQAERALVAILFQAFR